MMQILSNVLNSKLAYDEYSKFFLDYDGRDDQTTFARKLKDVHLPDYGRKN